MKLSDFLEKQSTDTELADLVVGLAGCCKDIKRKILEGDVGLAGSQNVYGEEQKALDVQSDEILLNFCKQSEQVGVAGSEELDDEVDTGDGEYAVCFDPLDGSSLIDVNLSVGSIISVYKSDSFHGTTGRDLKVGMFAVYGPRTTLVFTTGKGAHEFELDPKGDDWNLKSENLKISEDGKMFAPGNLGAAMKVEGYHKLLHHWMENGYKLRYSGGMVPDINQILLKGKGIFMYPGSPKNPNGKLRLLFECRPMAFVVEQSGGSATDGEVQILDKKMETMEDTSPIILGSRNEVVRAGEMMRSN